MSAREDSFGFSIAVERLIGEAGKICSFDLLIAVIGRPSPMLFLLGTRELFLDSGEMLSLFTITELRLGASYSEGRSIFCKATNFLLEARFLAMAALLDFVA